MTRKCDLGIGAAGKFVTAAGGKRWTFAGRLTFADATAVRAAALDLPLPTEGIIDCSGIESADSAAVAVLVDLKRRASEEKRTLEFANLPDALKELGALYGVEELLVG